MQITLAHLVSLAISRSYVWRLGAAVSALRGAEVASRARGYSYLRTGHVRLGFVPVGTSASRGPSSLGVISVAARASAHRRSSRPLRSAGHSRFASRRQRCLAASVSRVGHVLSASAVRRCAHCGFRVSPRLSISARRLAARRPRHRAPRPTRRLTTRCSGLATLAAELDIVRLRMNACSACRVATLSWRRRWNSPQSRTLIAFVVIAALRHGPYAARARRRSPRVTARLLGSRLLACSRHCVVTATGCRTHSSSSARSACTSTAPWPLALPSSCSESRALARPRARSAVHPGVRPARYRPQHRLEFAGCVAPLAHGSLACRLAGRAANNALQRTRCARR